jgi:hypothetical protein
MSLFGRDDLRALLAGAATRLQGPVDIIVVGGGALLALVPAARVTRDLDLLPTPGAAAFRRAVGAARGVEVGTAAGGFEALLPDGWESRLVLSDTLSCPPLRVFTPAPEDLAVMKLFRFLAKDAEDIRRLAALPGFDRGAFRERFAAALATAIGEPRWHAQSFELIWNALYPDASIDAEAILALAGRALPRR